MCNNYFFDIAAPLPPPRESNTNILMIKFGALSKPCKVHTGDPVVCSNDQCAAILSHLSKISNEETGEKKVLNNFQI